MNDLNKKTILFRSYLIKIAARSKKAGIVLIIFLSAYPILRAWLKGTLIDTFNLSLLTMRAIGMIEPFVFASIAAVVLIVTLRRQSPYRNKIFNGIHSNSFPNETKKLIPHIARIKSDLKSKDASFHEIPYAFPKTVYAIVGNWRAGKTTLSGILIAMLSQDKKINPGGEYYHDTFNFGNINESIHSFFDNIATITNIPEFSKLAYTATPADDIGFNVGIINVKKVFKGNTDINLLRSKIQQRLNEQRQVHFIIIDDIDRLVFEEQLQWLRTIELLGKFKGAIVLIVPINYAQVEANLLTHEISKKYLQKILPNTIDLGVDIEFIRKGFNLEASSPKDVRRKYAKYMFSLSIRACIARMRSNNDDTTNLWRNNFTAGAVSKIALQLMDTLARDPNTSEEIILSSEPRTIISATKTLFSNNEEVYDSSDMIILLRDNMLMGSGSAVTEPYENLKYKTQEKVYNAANLGKWFGELNFKEVERNALNYGSRFNNLSGQIINFWETIGFEAIKELQSDQSLSKYFTYDMIAAEIMTLKAVTTERDEAKVIMDFIRKGDYAE